MVKINIGKCIIEGCNNPQDTRHLCRNHYNKYLKYKDPYIDRTHLRKTRFWLGKKFSKDHRINLSKAHKGHKMPKSQREKIAKNNARYWLGKHRSKETKEKLRQGAIRALLSGKYRNKQSSIESKIEKELQRRNIYYQPQVSLCNVTIADFYLPKTKTIIYCDGEYWHGLKGRKDIDINQDVILSFNGYHVYRFTEAEINKSPSRCINKIIELEQTEKHENSSLLS